MTAAVVQTGSRLVRLACGTKRSVRVPGAAAKAGRAKTAPAAPAKNSRRCIHFPSAVFCATVVGSFEQDNASSHVRRKAVEGNAGSGMNQSDGLQRVNPGGNGVSCLTSDLLRLGYPASPGWPLG